jgi:hypothetical protein
MPLRCCVVCKRSEAPPDLQLQYCSVCQSALYCSEVCQKKDWRKQHKKICKHLNVGHGDMQLRDSMHTWRSTRLKEQFVAQESSFDEDTKRFFKLFEESTFDGSRAAALEMNQIAKRQITDNQKLLLYHSLQVLIRSDSEMLSWPNSPLLVLLNVDGDEPLQQGEPTERLLHHLADMACHSDYSTHENQLTLAKQLIEHGADVNAVSFTPLHNACYAGVVTNLDFVEYLLKTGADPNSQNHLGVTTLMFTTPYAPGAAKFLLNWPTTDANITTRIGESFLANVRSTITTMSDKVERRDNPDRVQHQFLLQQWREIEEMLVERGAIDTGITTLS